MSLTVRQMCWLASSAASAPAEEAPLDSPEFRCWQLPGSVLAKRTHLNIARSQEPRVAQPCQRSLK